MISREFIYKFSNFDDILWRENDIFVRPHDFSAEMDDISHKKHHITCLAHEQTCLETEFYAHGLARVYINKVYLQADERIRNIFEAYL